ncbi:unnamed protein product [Lactuca saligna]|uniref:Uncharacterized protein n=1 Tax=Lactuca saligna TaxID=75948 RepID=A0AA35YRW4_LACSI|nr:unnamed protein product [Lactuca saligna]
MTTSQVKTSNVEMIVVSSSVSQPELITVSLPLETNFETTQSQGREDVNFKIQELRKDMSKEIAVVQQDYASLNQKMDIIADAVTKFVKLYEILGHKVDQMSKDEVQSFLEINKLLTELKDFISKPYSSPLITPEFVSQKFILFESVLHKQLTPLSQLANILPTKARLLSQGCNGEKGSMLVKEIREKLVKKLKQVLKVMVIESVGEGSASKPKEIPTIQDRGKKVVVEKSKKERKAKVEAEMERHRHI